MKMLMAIIKPTQLDAVREALTRFGIKGLTVTEVHGFGRQGGHTETYRGSEHRTDFVPKMRLEVAIDDDQVEPVMEAIAGAARTGNIGDGKIFVIDLGAAMRIRTGETGSEAL